MSLKVIIKKTLGLSSASAINVALLSILSLLLAKILTVEEFGITRSVTAYMIVLTMIGHFTFHDALASMIAQDDDKKSQSSYFSSAAAFVVANSLMLSLASYIFIVYSGYWDGVAERALIVIVLCLPLMTISILFNTSLQAVGRTRTMALVQVVNGAAPCVIILISAFLYQMSGWITGRVITFVFLAIFSVYLIRQYIDLREVRWSTILKLMSFARIQIVSGILSLVLMSADIILLERLTGDMAEVAQYGLAIFFIKATTFVPTSISRIFFKNIAKNESGLGQFLLLVLVVCTLLAVIMYGLAPWIITTLYSGDYNKAADLIKHLCISVVLMGLWQAISTINIATGNPSRSVVVAFTGSLICIALLLYWVPVYASYGAAWAINISYGVGVLVGLYMLVRDKLRS